MRLPMITTSEWRALSAHLPPTHGPGKPRQDDRRYVSAFFYAEACRCSLDSLPAGYGNPRSLRTRRQRWEADGTMARLMKIGAPVIARMRNAYWGELRAASDIDSPDWKHSREFFGRGVIPRLPRSEPRGRYADRRRRVPAGR
jgi:transposase